ncbi:hypothetical protein ACSS7Z_13535 [Microbacterium sp. A82]|uniref:hypothetical protein n=1 Tax=Microbacterium sp. A82 TaxID=3450452 RepID=UPI003F335AE2
MRRLVIGAAAGVLVALAAATGVSAYWQAQQELQGGLVASGDLTVSATWVGGTPNWTGLYPGQSVERSVAVVVAPEGDNLKWTVNASSSNPNDAFTFQAWRGACGTGAALPATDSPETMSICVRYTLSSDAAAVAQGLTSTPTITITAEQVSG